MKLRDLLPLIENEYFCIMGIRDIYTMEIKANSKEVEKFLDFNVIRVYAEKHNSVPVYMARVCVVIDDRVIR